MNLVIGALGIICLCFAVPALVLGIIACNEHKDEQRKCCLGTVGLGIGIFGLIVLVLAGLVIMSVLLAIYGRSAGSMTDNGSDYDYEADSSNSLSRTARTTRKTVQTTRTTVRTTRTTVQTTRTKPIAPPHKLLANVQ